MSPYLTSTGNTHWLNLTCFYFFVCSCLWLTGTALGVLILRLQINISRQEILQLFNPQIVKISNRWKYFIESIPPHAGEMVQSHKQEGLRSYHANKKLNTTVGTCNPRLRHEDFKLETRLGNTVRKTLASEKEKQKNYSRAEEIAQKVNSLLC